MQNTSKAAVAEMFAAAELSGLHEVPNVSIIAHFTAPDGPDLWEITFAAGTPESARQAALAAAGVPLELEVLSTEPGTQFGCQGEEVTVARECEWTKSQSSAQDR